MNILVLEDDGFRVTFFVEALYTYNLKITENSNTAIKYLNEYEFDYIFLDNDLGENNGFGADVAAYLYEHQDNPNYNTQVIIHSWNVPAARAITGLLSQSIYLPYGTDDFFEFALDI